MSMMVKIYYNLDTFSIHVFFILTPALVAAVRASNLKFCCPSKNSAIPKNIPADAHE